MIPAIVAVLIIVLFLVITLVSIRSEVRNPDYRKMLEFMAFAIAIVIGYFAIVPYYAIEPTGEYIIYVVPENVTYTITSNNTVTTTVTEINVTHSSPLYRVSTGAYAWGYVVLAIALVALLLAMYYMFKGVIRKW